jgi:hypothetical protein
MGFYGSGFDGPSLETLYGEDQIAGTLTACNISVVGESENDFLCLCPFHSNQRTPSFSVSKTSGKFLCFNESCGEFGTLIELVKKIRNKNDFEAARIIHNQKFTGETLTFAERFESTKPVEIVPFDHDKIDQMHEALWKSPEALEYLTDKRNFTEKTLRDFKIGYSSKKNMIAVPMYDEFGMSIGVIGREVGGHSFKNSKRLPVRQTLWNIHNAKATGSASVVVCEASFDAMHVKQAGYPNVVACLGGNFNANHAKQLSKYFDTIIIATDWDRSSDYIPKNKTCRKCKAEGHKECLGHNPGRDIGYKIAELMKGKHIKWASYDYKRVYHDWKKDMSDLTDQQIREVIEGSVSHFEYMSWGIYYDSCMV